MPAPLTSTGQHNQQQFSTRGAPTKNVKYKSSKPIINWLQRKLGGSARARRASDPSAVRASGGHARISVADGSYAGRATGFKEVHTAMLNGRAASPRDVDENGHVMRGRAFRPLSNEISLNSIDGITDDDGESNRRSSGAAVSLWGSRSNPVEADEDASLRPLPPTTPPSPSPSRSSSSYMSNSHTFQSMSASTKPTTLLSIDLTPGMAHIAQAPPTPTSTSLYNTPGPSPIARFPPHVRTASTGPGGIVTFSALPPSTPPSSRPSSLGPAIRAGVGALQAPAHTSHHPRNNPRPSSPPLDNASVLTLASSAFAAPFSDRGRVAGYTPYQYSWTAGADSASHLGGTGDSFSHIMLDGELATDDQNASMRALRPRSSRRDSWESELSRWSAGVSVLGALGSAGRERSVQTAPSFRTGGQYTVDVDDTTSVSLIDEDLVSTREEGAEGVDEVRDGANDDEDRERALSPLSAMSIAEEPEERSPRVSESTEIDSQNLKDSNKQDLDDVATPGRTGRTLELSPSLDTMSEKERRPETTRM